MIKWKIGAETFQISDWSRLRMKEWKKGSTILNVCIKSTLQKFERFDKTPFNDGN